METNKSFRVFVFPFRVEAVEVIIESNFWWVEIFPTKRVRLPPSLPLFLSLSFSFLVSVLSFPFFISWLLIGKFAAVAKVLLEKYF